MPTDIKMEQTENRNTLADTYSSDSATKPQRYACTKKPFRPIYPVRYGLRQEYLESLVNNQSVDVIPQPKGIAPTTTHWLESLRQGFVYIYAPNGHKGSKENNDKTASDASGKWMIFRYNTDKDDINSDEKYTNINTNAHSSSPHFVRYRLGKNEQGKWVDGTVSDSWERDPTECTYESPFIHEETSVVYVAYSEYPWTLGFLEAIEAKTEFRDSIMTKVNPVPSNASAENPTYQAQQANGVGLLKEIEKSVSEFALRKKLFDQLTELKDWLAKKEVPSRYTQIIPNEAKFTDDERNRGLFVALTDTVGEIKELQNVHKRLLTVRQRYLAEHQYPLTIGSIIDPKMALEVKGQQKPADETIREIIEKNDRDNKFFFEDDALIPAFNDTYKKLLQDDYDNYQQPIKKVLIAITKLYNRQALVDLITQLDEDQKNHNNIPCRLESAGNVLSVLAACLNTMEDSETGIQYLNKILLGDEFDETQMAETHELESPPEWLAILERSTDLVEQLRSSTNPSAIAILTESNAALRRLFLGLERSAHAFGTKLAELAALGSKNAKGILFAMMRSYGIEISLTPMNFYDIYMQQMHFNRTLGSTSNQRINENFKNLVVEAGVTISGQTKNLLSKSFAVLGLYSGLVGLSGVSAKQQQLSRTTLGKISSDPIVLLSAATLDTGIALKAVSEHFKLITRTASTTVAGTLGARLATFVVGPIAVALTVVIMVGGAYEAWKKANYAKVISNSASLGAMISAGIVGKALTAGGTVLGITLGAASLMVLGLAAIILIIVVVAIAKYIDSDLETWVKTGFWGSSKYYIFWDEYRKKTIFEQIDIAKKLANVDLQEQYQALIANPQMEASTELKQYQQVFEGLQDELAFLATVSGLQIAKGEKVGTYLISCMGFRKDRSGEIKIRYTTGKTIKEYHYNHTQDKLSWHETKAEPPISGITREITLDSNAPLKIKASYENSEGEEFEGTYIDPDYR